MLNFKANSKMAVAASMALALNTMPFIHHSSREGQYGDHPHFPTEKLRQRELGATTLLDYGACTPTPADWHWGSSQLLLS